MRLKGLCWSPKRDYFWVLLKILTFESNFKAWSIRNHTNKGTSNLFLINWWWVNLKLSVFDFVKLVIDFRYCWFAKIHMIISSWRAIRFVRLHDSDMLKKISFALIFKKIKKTKTHIGFTYFRKGEMKSPVSGRYISKRKKKFTKWSSVHWSFLWSIPSWVALASWFQQWQVPQLGQDLVSCRPWGLQSPLRVP